MKQTFLSPVCCALISALLLAGCGGGNSNPGNAADSGQKPGSSTTSSSNGSPTGSSSNSNTGVSAGTGSSTGSTTGANSGSNTGSSTGSSGGSSTTPVADLQSVIHPSALWQDDAGNQIQAHGGGMFQAGGTYYWVGEDKTGETTSGTFQNVKCYSSKNLQSWHFEGNALSPQPTGDIAASQVVERPKVIFNDTTKQYVMYMHVDNTSYSFAKVGVATSTTPCGPYTYQGSFMPPNSSSSRDLGLFKDDDGTAYLLSEDRGIGTHIYKLTSDYLSVDSLVYTIGGPNQWIALEAPTMFKANGYYFVIGSGLTGWGLNDNFYMVASTPAGPWTGPTTLAPSGTDTFSSQSTYVLPITGSGGTTYMYMGDRWNGNYLQNSSYVWLPLQVNGGIANLPQWDNAFGMDLTTGLLQPAVSTSDYDVTSPGTSLSGGASSYSCSLCFMSRSAIGYVGGPGNGTVTFGGISAQSPITTIAYISYINNDANPRYATVTTNGGTGVVVTFPPTGTYGGTVPVAVNLVAGANSISISSATVSGQSTPYGPDIEELFFDN
ncbi:family 43 glycosylhydrolase [Paraburkholderia sediminicola]|uniref:family 43 glycosylhydrolase n=1 Tax=Paraburkholderia sediminicola TaxID=458836 RepID=UPI0038B7B420